MSLEVFDPIVVPTQDLIFTVNAADNVTLLMVEWTVTGVITKDSLIQFTRTTASYSQQVTLTGPFTPGFSLIVAKAMDGSGSKAIPDSASVMVIQQ